MESKKIVTGRGYRGGRPKNFKEDSVVISIRVPKSKKDYYLKKVNEMVLNDKITEVYNNAK